jgi:hypothetical protein
LFGKTIVIVLVGVPSGRLIRSTRFNTFPRLSIVTSANGTPICLAASAKIGGTSLSVRLS